LPHEQVVDLATRREHEGRAACFMILEVKMLDIKKAFLVFCGLVTSLGKVPKRGTVMTAQIINLAEYRKERKKQSKFVRLPTISSLRTVK
jgi:hypothetical protein